MMHLIEPKPLLSFQNALRLDYAEYEIDVYFLNWLKMLLKQWEIQRLGEF